MKIYIVPFEWNSETAGSAMRQESDSMEFFLCVIGMVMVIEGLPYFAFPEKMKVWIQKVMEMPDSTLRRFGLTLMIVGLWFVYLGKQ